MSQVEIVAVVTQPDRPAGRKLQLQPSAIKILAQKLGLPVHQPESVNTAEFREMIAALGAESGVVVAFGQILGRKFLDLFPRGLVNVHASLLPRWRGAAPIQRSLMAGDRQTGVSLQRVVSKLDAGPVLGERRLDISDDMDAVELHDRLSDVAAGLLEEEYISYLNDSLQPVEQDESLVTLAPKIDKIESRLGLSFWQGDARVIHNKIRGLAMGPRAYIPTRAGPLKISQTRVVEGNFGTSAPGSVAAIGVDGLVLACGSRGLEVRRVQPESRASMAVAEFLRGRPLQVGDQLVEEVSE